MNTFIKAAIAVLITVILCLFLQKQSKDYTIILTVVVCCMVTIAAVSYLEPIFDFFSNLVSIGNLDSGMLKILLKAVGISLLTEFISLICKDFGNATLGNALQLLASAVILWLSIPVLTSLLELIQTILSAS